MCVCVCLCVLTQSCCTLCDPMGCSLPGSSVHGIFQARILEWAVISYSRASSQHTEIEPASLTSPVLAGGYFTTEPPGKPFSNLLECKILVWRGGSERVWNIYSEILPPGRNLVVENSEVLTRMSYIVGLLF